MTTLSIEKIKHGLYQVTITDAQTTTHQVTVLPAYAQQLTAGKTNIETLLEKSFEFLLAREPNTSILHSFELSIISHYFSAYEDEIKRMFDVGNN